MFSSQNRSQNNGFRLERFRFREVMRRNWFSYRVVDEWNGLGNHIVGAESIGRFKRRLDKFKEEDDE